VSPPLDGEGRPDRRPSVPQIRSIQHSDRHSTPEGDVKAQRQRVGANVAAAPGSTTADRRPDESGFPFPLRDARTCARPARAPSIELGARARVATARGPARRQLPGFSEDFDLALAEREAA
jgi:hypothetical protein